MSELRVGTMDDLADGRRRLVTVDGREVGVLLHEGQLFAYENRCLHQGGPVCEGIVLGKVEPLLDVERQVLGERFSEAEPHLICPWHGWEYELWTGRSVSAPGRSLRRYRVERRGDDVYVRC